MTDELRSRMEARLTELRKELETGQARLAEVEAEARHVRETLLRISGAIQVIEEALKSEEGPEPAGGGAEDR
jgi:hypothetical protein